MLLKIVSDLPDASDKIFAAPFEVIWKKTGPFRKGVGATMENHRRKMEMKVKKGEMVKAKKDKVRTKAGSLLIGISTDFGYSTDELVG